MSNDEKEKDDDLKNGFSSANGGEDGLPEESLSSKMKSLEEEVEGRRREYNDLYDRYLMIAADFDNYKKRVAKEKADIIAYGNEELIKELLHVLDNLERALEHSESAERTGPIVEGVRLVYKQFLSCLEKFGVKPINAAKGEKFDPSYHQAIERVESSEITPGFILSQILKGYTLKDRLLRPSLVVVSREKEGTSTSRRTSVKSESEDKINSSDSEEILDLVDEELE